MMFRYIEVELDVTPKNWSGSRYFDSARVVHEWVAKGSTPEMLGDIRNTFGLAELQAVTVSVQKPNVVFRMCMPHNRTVDDVLAFTEKVRRQLAAELDRAGVAYNGPSADEIRAGIDRTIRNGLPRSGCNVNVLAGNDRDVRDTILPGSA